MSTENIFEKERRLKARRQTFKQTYRKGYFFSNKENIKKALDNEDVLVRAIASGTLDDGTDFITVTIEGINPETFSTCQQKKQK